ncbi:hypothetical protein LCGC14_2850050 [marine sediment metagenome]|uniref:Cell wall hydrolase SleB domain-containing protein n=1 Tax=marine sediment metagenome TaxID=412755 RepID=A0A0F8YVE4_9ZZZZ
MKRLILALVLCHPLHWALVAGAIQVWPEPPLPATMAKTTTLAVLAPDPEVLWLEMDADLLADVALGEDSEALAAVMWTVLNRRRFDGQLLETVIQHRQSYGSMRGGRFWASWRAVPGLRWSTRPCAWARAVETAYGVLLGFSPDPTRGAKFFHRSGTWAPPWAPHASEWVLVGSHHFYKAAA